ncbi:C40 family peptidase [Streptomyces sp. H27-D2]|uniref:C40 family peptidase n=1 Tax=Streptomyces sp. H27-D2 TaxID=3046304 RepID=UPI002DBFE4B6|nr:NlpC/P60 family protein [Streptomyces sp. H27-D2]MEC4015995.1 NlpC/P60 family protein [Streptomyces sp. H27-D2]
MASHRKPRNRMITSPASRRTAVGLTTAAFASVTLLSQSATAAPSEPKRQSVEEVRKKVDSLYREAGSATQQYNSAKEHADKQRGKVDGLLDDVAERTEQLNESRRALGTYAAAQYRSGGMTPTATLMLADDPQDFFDQTHLMDRMTGRQQKAVTTYQEQQAAASKKRAQATRNLASLTESQKELKSSKQTVQNKLGEARELLSKLTAAEKAKLAAIEREKEAAAQRKADALARQQAEKERKDEQARKAREQGKGGDGGSESGSGGSTGGDTGDPGKYATKAEKAIAFARQQMGKPYVWGAAGPNSYDCSGLTQGAWKAAGVSLPRTTWDQVKVGTRVATGDLKPGDLVFFYDDISHVGLYIGGGKMIHAPKPGASVRIESIYYMPIYGSVRPA